MAFSTGMSVSSARSVWTTVPDTDACSGYRPKIAALIDSELPAPEREELEQHLASCAGCTVELNRQRMAQSALHRLSGALTTPEELRSRIDALLAQPVRRGRLSRRLAVLGGMAAAAVLALLALAGWYRQNYPVPSPSLLALSVEAHQQKTNGPAPVSLSSSDAVVVAAWARERVDKQFDLPSLDAAGYHLVGARLEPDVDPRAVTLVYEGGETRLSCTVVPISSPILALLPLPPSAPARADTIHGSTVVTWRDGDATYLLVADLNADALLRLARLAAQSD
jgi:anti-sigma factor RsiW